jgi:hypothetical protein
MPPGRQIDFSAHAAHGERSALRGYHRVGSYSEAVFLKARDDKGHGGDPHLLMCESQEVRQLTKAGCKKVFCEVATGAKTDRAHLRWLLDAGAEDRGPPATC